MEFSKLESVANVTVLKAQINYRHRTEYSYFVKTLPKNYCRPTVARVTNNLAASSLDIWTFRSRPPSPHLLLMLAEKETRVDRIHVVQQQNKF